MSFMEIAKEVLEIEANELIIASKNIDKSFDKAIELIYSTKGKVIITGVGKSGLIGAKIAATLASTGTSSFFLHPTEAMHGDLGMISKGDLVLAISYSGESDELIKILPHLKRFDIPLIAMSKEQNSTLAQYSDIFLSIAVNKEACPLNAAPTSSTTLTMALGDALAIALMKKRDFKQEDFASYHPGGSLGKKLFVKVDNMLRRKNLPIVSRETSIKDAIIKISEGRIGNVIISEHGKLFGVVSDGDLRRALMKDDFNINNPVITIATTNPKTIDNKNILASEALSIIEEYKIQLLIVLNELEEIEGVLHIHDLIEAGISSNRC